MQKLRKRMGFAVILALPIALGASLLTNLEDSNSSVVSNDVMTLSHTGGVNDHEDDGNTWTALTASFVDSNGGEVLGSTIDGGTTYYYLENDVELNSNDLTITGNVALCLNGNILFGTGNDSVITISSGATLTLHDCKYGNEDYSHDYYLDTSNYNISVFGDESNTEWLSEYNAALADNSENVGTVYGGVITGGRNSFNGGGVYANGGTLVMEGGTIAGNISYYFGGGVYVYDAIFTLNNGTISNNTALYSGGAVRMRDGTFVMNGGVIKNNIASLNYGGGVYLDVDSDFTLNNGIISENTAIYGGGVYFADDGIFTMYGGTISKNAAERTCGGVEAKYFYMYNGTISNNEAGWSSGGVYVYIGEFVMYNGSISNNMTNGSYSGGGVYVSACEFTMHNGTISENTANNGGGVYVNNGKFTMHNGDILDNIASYSGGGVHLTNESTLTMHNGTISNNTASANNGGGVYVDSDSTFTLNNGTISSNTAIYSSVSLFGGDGVYAFGKFSMIGGYLDDEIKSSSSSGISITGGYFSFNPSDHLTNNDYVAINIENLGGKSFDQDYVDGYSFAVYKVGTTLEEDIPTLTVIVEDITICPNLDYEDMIQINVNYDVVSYSYTISGEGLPTGNLIYKVTATFNNVMVEIEGVKTYYEGPMTTEFEVKMSHTPADEVTIENEVDATCYRDGGYDEVIYCIVCGDELSREAVITDLATGHSYSNELNNDAYYHWYAATCEHSNEVKDRAEHTYGDWEATSDGIEQRTCSVCGYLETNVIATSESGLTTGEITGIAIGGVALVGVIANLIIMLAKSKKNS